MEWSFFLIISFAFFPEASNSPGTRSQPSLAEPSSGNSNEDATRPVQQDESTLSNDLAQQELNPLNPLVTS